MQEMAKQIKTDASDKKWWDYHELWNTHEARRRLICVLGMACFGQISGNSLSSYYMAAMLKSAGITDEKKVLALNGINPVLCFFGAILGARMTDVLGRRYDFPFFFPVLVSTAGAESRSNHVTGPS